MLGRLMVCDISGYNRESEKCGIPIQGKWVTLSSPFLKP